MTSISAGPHPGGRMSEFLHMGGYAFYVWGSYGLAAIVLAANVILPVLRLRETRRDLERLARARAGSGE